eukprot:5229940-Pleurochrysis_carterae.AAC.1
MLLRIQKYSRVVAVRKQARPAGMVRGNSSSQTTPLSRSRVTRMFFQRTVGIVMSRIGVMAGVSCLSSLGPEQKARAATSTCANAAEAIDDSYEAWQFKQNCSVHNCMIGIALSSCVCTALLFDLDKEAKLRAVLRAAFSAAFILMRIGAQEAKDQLRAQRFMVTTLYVLTVIRLSSETFSKAASPDTLEYGGADVVRCTPQRVVCSRQLAQSVAAAQLFADIVGSDVLARPSRADLGRDSGLGVSARQASALAVRADEGAEGRLRGE